MRLNNKDRIESLATGREVALQGSEGHGGRGGGVIETIRLKV
jgi:hypothetical protein